MYSSESGVDTDHEARSQECKLIAVIPNKAQYNTTCHPLGITILCLRLIHINVKEKLVLLFSNDLSDKGSYYVEFKGHKRSKMDVKANKANKCTLLIEAPIYHPVEEVKINVRHRTHEGSKIIGSVPFRFLSRDEILADILRDYAGDPVTFMCESLGISPSDISALDEALAVTFKRNMPKGFNLLGLHNDSIGKEPFNSVHPTLLHFAAAFGLLRLTKDCLLQCPGVCEASKMRNCRGMKPSEIAENGGYEELAEEILRFQSQQEDSIYESMEKEDAEYLQMAPGYINLQLWQESYVEIESDENREGDFYEDMFKKTEVGDDIDHGYVDANRPHVQQSDDLYMDMNQAQNDDDDNNAGHYIDVANEQYDDLYENCAKENNDPEFFQGGDDQEFYETMVGDTGLGESEDEGYPGQDSLNSTYDTPSSLPVSSLYPNARSASMSCGAGPRRPKKPARDLPKEEGAPPVPRRLTGAEATSPRERLPSTGSKISTFSNTSSASGASTSTTGSGHDGDVEDDEEGNFMSREELIRQLENKQKENQRTAAKSSRLSAASKSQDNSYAASPPPPIPPADYDPEQQVSPPPVPFRAHSPRPTRTHGRSKTAPVNPIDVQIAQNSNRSTSRSIKETSGARQGQGVRPHLHKKLSSDLTHTRAPPPPPTITDERRNSSETCVSRPPAPSPVHRPPAPVPKEPLKGTKGRVGVVATPMVLALEQQGDEHPLTPKRGTSAAPQPPKLQPRPAPRKR